MSNSFHLALPAGDLQETEKFYTEILGCKTGNREKGKWVDIDFWGNELTLHQTKIKLPRERHDVDMGNVPVPHFGVHLKKEVFEHIKSNLESKNISYIDSSGLWALFESHKKANQKNGKIVLLSPKKDVKRVLDITKMSTKINIFAKCLCFFPKK